MRQKNFEIFHNVFSKKDFLGQKQGLFLGQKVCYLASSDLELAFLFSFWPFLCEKAYVPEFSIDLAI